MIKIYLVYFNICPVPSNKIQEKLDVWHFVPCITNKQSYLSVNVVLSTELIM